jgi:hypothetical protein
LDITGSIKENVALVDPHLHANATKRRVGMNLCVINICTKGVQWHAALTLIGNTGDFGTTQTA